MLEFIITYKLIAGFIPSVCTLVCNNVTLVLGVSLVCDKDDTLPMHSCPVAFIL